MKEQLLYKNLARYYDLVYNSKDYKKESEKIFKLISKYKKSKGRQLLDVACGSGKHLQYFSKKYSCVGIDLSGSMLEEAKKRIKNVNFKKGNMINFKLSKKFDIITCLFSSIGYVKTYTNLKRTLKNFYNHLNRGGLVIIEPWFEKNKWKKKNISIQTYEDKKIGITRMSFSSIKKKNISVKEMHYLIGENNEGIKHFTEKHEMGLFEIKEFLKIMREIGFKTKYLKKGLSKRGLYIGIK